MDSSQVGKVIMLFVVMGTNIAIEMHGPSTNK